LGGTLIVENPIQSLWKTGQLDGEGIMAVFKQGTHKDEAWQDKAACRGPQSSLFFPPTTSERKEERLRREARAKSVCGPCPVAKQCLEYALEIEEIHGIWGGLNEAERKELLLKRAKKAS
jgi:WhiB family redox-sensing transcriptional regulator